MENNYASINGGATVKCLSVTAEVHCQGMFSDCINVLIKMIYYCNYTAVMQEHSRKLYLRIF